jgi:hypothetical protein
MGIRTEHRHGSDYVPTGDCGVAALEGRRRLSLEVMVDQRCSFGGYRLRAGVFQMA